MNARATSRASCSWQAPPYGNPVGNSGGRGQHCRRRCGGHPLVAADPVDGMRAQADARHAVLGEVHAGALLVGALEHAVERARRGRVAPVRRERGDRRGVDDRPEPALLRCLEHVHRPDDVHPGAEQRVGSHERNLERREVDDPPDVVPGDRRAEGRRIRDVALNVGNRVRLVAEQQPKPPRIGRQVERDDLAARPGRARGRPRRRCSRELRSRGSRRSLRPPHARS